MTAPNHALTGAIIGLTISNPLLALPLAFLSHLVCDAIPHYDARGTEVERLNSKRFVYEQLLIGGALCVLLVLILVLTRPHHWFLAAICAFLATSPDLFWIPRFLHIKRTGQDVPLRNWFLRLHAALQWRTGPSLWWVEAVWAVMSGALVVALVW